MLAEHHAPRAVLALAQTIQRVNKCFGVAVASEAMDGAAPTLNPGRVHRRNNSYTEARHTLKAQHDLTADFIADKYQNFVTLPPLQPTAVQPQCYSYRIYY